MAIDKELIGVEFVYIWSNGQTFKGYVAQADPDIGITVLPLDEDEFLKSGGRKNIEGEVILMCIREELLYPGETLEEDYAKHKKLILEDGCVDVEKLNQGGGGVGSCAFR